MLLLMFKVVDMMLLHVRWVEAESGWKVVGFS